MRTFSIILSLLILATVGLAQTRKINHRSHSGTPETFAFMMDDDHLGNPDPKRYNFNPIWIESYNLQPWIDSLKRKYPPATTREDGSPVISPEQKNEAPVIENPTKGIDPKDSLAPAALPQQRQPTTPPKEGGYTADAAQYPAAPELGSNTAFPASAMAAVLPKNAGNSLGLLFALLLFPVAPAVFLLSAVWSSQRKTA